jgi:hypothetical protein
MEDNVRTGFILVLLSFVSPPVPAQLLYVVPDGVETRWASPENPIPLKAGEQRALAEVKSAIWRKLVG